EALKCDLLIADPWFRESQVATLRFEEVTETGALLFLPEWATPPPPGVTARPLTVERALYDALAEREPELLALRPGIASGPYVGILRLVEWPEPPAAARDHRPS